MHLGILDFVVIVCYFAVLALVGLYFSRRQTSRSEYFLGGRETHWALAGGSLLATVFSSISYLSLPGEMIRYGVGMFTGYLALPLVVPLISSTVLPVIKRLPITSVYEYLERRFDVSVRSFSACAFIVRTLLWMGLVIYMTSFAVVEMSGWNVYVTILLTGVLTAMYTSVGGMRTVIWTDNFQTLILFGGAISIPLLIGVLLGSGPATWWQTFSQAGRADVQFFSWDPTVRITIVGTFLNVFFWNMCTHSSDQLAVQRLLSTPSLESARRTLWFYTAASLVLPFFLALCGVGLFVFYSEQSDLPIQAFHAQLTTEADRLMPRFIVEVLPSGFSGLLLAALLAAAMSSLSSGINSISSVISSDFVERFGWGGKRTESLWLEKAIAFVAGLVGVCVAIGIMTAVRHTDWNLLELTSRVNHIFVGPIAALFFGGVLFRKARKRSALFGFAIGVCTSVYICFGKEWFGLDRSISFVWVVAASFVFGVAAIALASYFDRRPGDEDRAEGLTV